MPMGQPSSLKQLPYDYSVITPILICFCSTQWNKIEHRLFSFISRNWRGRPLTDYRTIVELIGATTSTAGLTVRCELDENLYPAGIKVSDEDMAQLNILRDDFHGEWNYTIKPRPAETAR